MLLTEMEGLQFAVDVDSVIATTRRLDLNETEMSVMLTTTHDDFSVLNMNVAGRMERERSSLMPMHNSSHARAELL